MLDLGPERQVRPCTDVSDPSGWTETSGIMRDTYEEVYKRPCDGGIVLGYESQFIASAHRIQHVDRRVYEALRTALVDKRAGRIPRNT